MFPIPPLGSGSIGIPKPLRKMLVVQYCKVWEVGKEDGDIFCLGKSGSGKCMIVVRVHVSSLPPNISFPLRLPRNPFLG